MVAWYRFIHDSLAQQLRKLHCSRGPCLRVHALKLRERETARRWDEVNDNMSDCHGSSHALGCTGPYNCYSVSRTRHPTHARTHTDTYTRGRPFNFPSVSRFCAERSGIRLFRVVYLSRMPGLLYGAPSLLACLLRLGLFFSSFFWNLRWASRDRFASLLLWWGFKLEIICRVMGVRVATLPSLFSVELNVPLLSFPKRGKTIGISSEIFRILFLS